MFPIVCVFNITGIIPFLYQLWSSIIPSEVSKIIMSDPKTWLVVYTACLVGYILYAFMPTMISKIYMLQVKLDVENLKKKKKQIVLDWNIE